MRSQLLALRIKLQGPTPPVQVDVRFLRVDTLCLRFDTGMVDRHGQILEKQVEAEKRRSSRDALLETLR